MSDIPRAREIIELAARMMDPDDPARAMLQVALPMLTRESPVRRASIQKRRLTARLTKQICDYARQNPAAHLSDIAVHFNVNPGRVSEVLNGKR
jgi:hypothetical protein